MSSGSSSKHGSSRHSPSASSPTTSKLPKFLQNKSTRDRSKSVGIDPAGSTSSLGSSGSGGKDGRGESTSPDLSAMSTPVPGSQFGGNKKKGSKFLGLRGDRGKYDAENDRERRGSSDSGASGAQSHSHSNSTTSYSTSSASNMSSTPTSPTGTDISDPPIIIEPPTRLSHSSQTPRTRTRSERPLSALASSASSPPGASLFPSNSSSTSKIGDLPTRLSGWFSHAFSASSTDLSLPTILAQHHGTARPPQLSQGPVTETPTKRANPLLAAAKHGKGHLDKAMRYLLDSDALPDKSTEPIWLLGVLHSGWEPSQEEDAAVVGKGSQHGHGKGLSSSVGPGSRSSPSTSPPPSSFRMSTSSMEHTAHPLSTSLSSSMGSSRHSVNSSHFKEKEKPPKEKDPSANWPPIFYADFTSRVWLTYRSHFGTPIKDGRLADLPCVVSTGGRVGSSSNSTVSSDVAVGSPTTVKRAWGWGGEKTWSSDSGWGCMLRTGQSLLANALIFQHLGRDWRRPPHPLHTADYATYVQILTWFLDTPSPDAPFSVHRMALAGKDLGIDVGQWFGPSTAAGAIRTLVNAFPECGLGVSVANDGALYQSDVFAASHGDFGNRSPKKHSKWGDRPVLLLLGIRLGLDGVNPVYYDTIKQLYTFPQSVGIAGGRPSSSYYFMGSQADNLFYLDPHQARPAIPLRPPPVLNKNEQEMSPDSDRDGTGIRNRKQRSASTSYHHRVPTSPSSTRTGSSTFSYHAPTSPSPLQQQFSTSSTDSSASYAASTYSHSRSAALSHQHGYGRWNSSSQPGSPGTSEMDYRELGIVGNGLDPVQEHYVTAYSAAELRTFHCERVRKMPMSGLDPSMLIGFLCRDEIDWWDFRRRVGELPRTIFSVQDEPPNWTNGFDDDDVGLESMSDELDMDMGEDEDSGEQFFDTRSHSGSPSESSHHERSERSKSEEIDTEEDPVDPVTPGPNSKFAIVQVPKAEKDGKDKELEFNQEDEDFNDDIEDDWIDPSVPTPSMLTPTPGVPYSSTHTGTSFASSQQPSEPVVAPPLKQRKSSSSKKGKKTKKQVPVPVPMVRIPSPPSQEHYPFPVTPADDPSATPQERSRTNSISNNKDPTHRMHTARARDGGRTQSGGVKGILTDD